ncbi:MAG: hypothetical protein AAF847_09905 [Bacteroidota bacterium]
MAGLRFFKTPKPQRFEYKPRYYDEAKEDLKKRVRDADAESDYSTSDTKQRISGSFRRKTSGYNADRGFRSRQVKRSNVRLLMIIVVLFLMGYLLFRANFDVLEGFLQNTYGY